jgi:hypothetical protein
MVLASDLILRVIALNDETHSQGDYINTSHYAGRLLATLHGTSDLKPGAELQFETRHEGTAPFAIYKGTQVIILGAEPPNEGAIYYPHCGAIPATPENLSRVMKAAPNIPPATPN